MTPEDRKHAIYEAMSAYCEPKGFELLGAHNQFRRPTPHGFQTVILSLSADPKSTLFEAHLGVRHDALERIVFPFTGGRPLFRDDSMTLVASTAKLQDKPFERFEVATEADARGAVETVVGFLEHEGMTWLDTHQEAEAIHQALNLRPLTLTRLLPNQLHRCFRGLAVARLVEAPDYVELESAYDALLAELHAPEYQRERFEELKAYLRKREKPDPRLMN